MSCNHTASNEKTRSESGRGSAGQSTTTIELNGHAQEVDLIELAQKLYDLFRRDLRVEQERLGRIR